MEIALYKALLEAGVKQDTAANLVESLNREVDEKISSAKGNLVTRDYLDAKMSAQEATLKTWTIGTIIATAAIATAIARFMH